MVTEASEHTFDTVVGHDLIKRLIIRMIESDRLPNVILFAGMEGIGKRSLGYSLVKRIVCEKEDKGRDNCSCDLCRKIRTKKILDIYNLVPSGAINQIGIEDVRVFQDSAGIYPAELSRKVLFIHDADRLNVNAANALLKLLEEPPDHLLMLLFTNNLSAMLPTIRSRCTLLQLHPIPVDLVVSYLQENLKMNEKDARVAAYFSEGSITKAIGAASGNLAKKRKSVLDHISFLLANGESGIPAASYKLLNSLEGTKEVFQIAMILFRDIMMMQVFAKNKNAGNIPQGIIMNSDQVSELSDEIKSLTHADAFGIIKKLMEKYYYTRRIVNNDLLMRNVLFDICQSVSEKE